MEAKSINIFVNDAGHGASRTGVFFRRELVCGLGGEIPTEYLDQQVTVKFESGLRLDCLGSEVIEFAKDRT